MTAPTKNLEEFAKSHGFSGKGPLAVALVVTRRAMRAGLPLDADSLLTEGGGQVVGLGKGAVQAILKDYGIARVLAEEGGRTSRGSVGHMREYVVFLNDLHRKGQADLEVIEKWWIERVRSFFAAKPFTLRLDPSKSLRSAVRDLLEQAQKRQTAGSGTMFAGTVLQHLVGAKLELLLAPDAMQHHGASVADQAAGRVADFLVGDVAIHVTTAPGEAIIRKCERNLHNGLSPLVVTTYRGVSVAEELADQGGIAGRVDVFDAEQFLAGNIYELSRFAQSTRRTTVELLISKYNQIVDACETDPGLHIDIGR